MTWNTAEIISQVRDRSELDANNTDLTATKLLSFVNQALKKISLAADWPWLRVTGTATAVAGTETVTTPTGWLRTRLLTHVDTGEALTRVNLAVVRRTPVSSTGRPGIYSVDGSVITLRYVPDATYSITHDYVRFEPTLTSATTDVPLIPEVYGQGLIEYAAIKSFQRQQKQDKAAEAKADYLAWLQDTRDNINQGRGPLGVTPRPGAWL